MKKRILSGMLALLMVFSLSTTKMEVNAQTIDIVEYNYYYDFAPVGSNSITFTRPYSMTFYNN